MMMMAEVEIMGGGGSLEYPKFELESVLERLKNITKCKAYQICGACIDDDVTKSPKIQKGQLGEKNQAKMTVRHAVRLLYLCLEHDAGR